MQVTFCCCFNRFVVVLTVLLLFQPFVVVLTLQVAFVVLTSQFLWCLVNQVSGFSRITNAGKINYIKEKGRNIDTAESCNETYLVLNSNTFQRAWKNNVDKG